MATLPFPLLRGSGAWIEPDLERRETLVARWREPDYASVNLSEPGAGRVMRALLDAGIGVEAGFGVSRMRSGSQKRGSAIM